MCRLVGVSGLVFIGTESDPRRPGAASARRRPEGPALPCHKILEVRLSGTLLGWSAMHLLALSSLLAEGSNDVSPVGTDLLPWLVLAVGAAMVFGNVVALVRPPPSGAKGDLRRAPIARTVVMIAVGFIGAVWSLASLLKG